MNVSAVAAALTRNGYYICAAVDFPVSKEVVEFALASEQGSPVENKDFFKRLMVNAAVDNALARAANHPDLLSIAEQYLGHKPAITALDVYVSKYTGDRLRSSQRYHLDRDARPQIKLFINCSDVVFNNGPLTFISARDSESVIKNKQRDPLKRLDDTEVIGHKEIQFASAPGAACFVDTSRCYHYGSRVLAGADDRVVVVIQYV